MRILFILFTCITSSVCAQENVGKIPPARSPLQAINTFNKEENQKVNLPVLSSAFYAQHLPFFCRQEIKIEHALHTPLKIRVGSIESCNYLEQKPGYQYLNK